MSDPKPSNFQYTSLDNSSALGLFKILLNYIINDIQKKPRSFKIGIFTIFLVIGFTSAVQSIFQLSPIIFLTISENTAGDADMYILPDLGQVYTSNSNTNINNNFNSNNNSQNSENSINFKLLNQTKINEVCEKMDQIEGCSPRWLIFGDLWNPKDFYADTANQNNFLHFSSYIVAGDLKKERSIGVGRRLDVGLLQKNEAYISESTATGLGLKSGDKVIMHVDFINDFLLNEDFMDQSDFDSSNIDKFLTDFIYDILIQSGFPDTEFQTSEIRDQADELSDLVNEYDEDGESASQALEDALKDFFEEQGVDPGNSLDPISEQNAKEFSDQFSEFANDLDQDSFSTYDIAEELTPAVKQFLNYTQEFTIKETIDAPKGKWPEVLGHVLLIDAFKFKDEMLQKLYDTIYEQIFEQDDDNDSDNDFFFQFTDFFIQENQFEENFKNFTKNLDINEYAITSYVVVKNRMNIYDSQEHIDEFFTSLSDNFYKEIGKDNQSFPEIPLATAVGGILLLKLFLDQMILIVVFLLLMLSILLIYSLMLSDIEEKTYEFGMLRALGMKQQSLVYLILIQSLFFAIPGLSLGLLMAYMLNSIVGYLIFDSGQEISSYQLHYTAIIMALLLGFFIPIISNYFPIKRALGKTLRNSLDLYHRSINEMTVHVIKLEKMGISLPQTIIALTLIFVGLVSYYLAPQAFLNEDFGLFLLIINLIMILMILGFTLLANLFQPILEKLIVSLFICVYPKDKGLKSLILKNLKGHAKRNNKTTLMYTVSLAFLIFSEYSLDEQTLRDIMEEYKVKNPDHIQDYSFVSQEFSTIPQSKRPFLSPLSQFPEAQQYFYGVEENFLKSAMLDFYIPTEQSKNIEFENTPNGQVDLVSGLFNIENLEDLDNQVDFYGIATNHDIIGDKSWSSSTQEKQVPLLISEGLRKVLSADTEIPLLLKISSTLNIRAKAAGLAKKMPVFSFSSYRTIEGYGDILTSMEAYRYVVQKYYGYLTSTDNVEDNQMYEDVIEYFQNVIEGSTYNIPKKQMLIRFQKELTKEEREQLINSLRISFTSDDTSTYDVPTLISSMQSSLNYIVLFSIVVSIISMILSFFLILVSFIANIKESSWEFGVLRAIGLDKKQITRVYIFESMALILTAGIIGTFIGIITAVAVTAQLLMFMEFPFTFIFPWTMFSVTFVLSIVISVGGSYYAIKEFKDRSIANIVKGIA
ncbi:hypothetical protein PPERSA_09033 [Pseudocohnilembus persalinus]|uniref:ABC3 transporter permease C-terminal domain-containing protein n=1 Tax=Pseudocohnilembus persalinus TaxID=266149 RepID=A0A0V0R364_PSEPJ|nr:hypothetical protein PPERSA_09033 [Pseudocohnilembus persalinus]|eukprot:KRX08929.1 hypothetical protein PPERSA_09033 [Pseudocohnilembus persalinus]